MLALIYYALCGGEGVGGGRSMDGLLRRRVFLIGPFQRVVGTAGKCGLCWLGPRNIACFCM